MFLELDLLLTEELFFFMLKRIKYLAEELGSARRCLVAPCRCKDSYLNATFYVDDD